jgi:hypothetical protein
MQQQQAVAIETKRFTKRRPPELVVVVDLLTVLKSPALIMFLLFLDKPMKM